MAMALALLGSDSVSHQFPAPLEKVADAGGSETARALPRAVAASMKVILTGYLVAATVCVMVAVQWLLVAMRGPERRTHLLFAACALVVAVDGFFVERRFIGAQSPEELTAIVQWQGLAITSFLALLALFLAFRTASVRPWLLAVVLGLLAASAVLAIVEPEALFITIESIRESTLPWGETLRFGRGAPGRWRVVGTVRRIVSQP